MVNCMETMLGIETIGGRGGITLHTLHTLCSVALLVNNEGIVVAFSIVFLTNCRGKNCHAITTKQKY